MSVKITGRLVTQSGKPSGLDYVIVRSESVRASVDGEMITGESVHVPVGEDGVITFEAEPGPAVIVVWREPSQYSRYEVVPLWIPEEDTSLAEAFRLGQAHSLDTTSPSVIELISDLVDSAVSVYEDRILDRVEEMISEIPGGDIELEGYATEEWVNGRIETISLTPGQDGKDGQDGDSAYEIWLSAGNEGTEADFLESLKGDRGDRGDDGQDGQDGKDGQDGSSAYEIWLSAGNEGTEAEFLESLKGGKGDRGEKGDRGDKGEDGQDGQPGQPGQPGDSAYEIWLSAGNTGTEVDFISSLKGEKGDPGEPGSGGGSGGSQEELVLWIESDDQGLNGNTTRITRAKFNGSTVPIPVNGTQFTFTGGYTLTVTVKPLSFGNTGFTGFSFGIYALWKIETVFTQGEFKVSQGGALSGALTRTSTPDYENGDIFGTLEGVFGDFDVVDTVNTAQDFVEIGFTRFDTSQDGKGIGQAVLRITPMIRY